MSSKRVLHGHFDSAQRPDFVVFRQQCTAEDRTVNPRYKVNVLQALALLEQGGSTSASIYFELLFPVGDNKGIY